MTLDELRAIRQWLNDFRMVVLDGFIMVNDAIKRAEAEQRRALKAELKQADKFKPTTNHEDYAPKDEA